jgi:hypothetical protein
MYGLGRPGESVPLTNLTWRGMETYLTYLAPKVMAANNLDEAEGMVDANVEIMVQWENQRRVVMCNGDEIVLPDRGEYGGMAEPEYMLEYVAQPTYTRTGNSPSNVQVDAYIVERPRQRLGTPFFTRVFNMCERRGIVDAHAADLAKSRLKRVKKNKLKKEKSLANWPARLRPR